MIEVRQTDEYSEWFANLRDKQARARINARIRRLSLGNPGDVKPVGEGFLNCALTMVPAIGCIEVVKW
jgi:putative addiction module killer protein